jgi:hydroxypyruvate isomerase
MPKFSANLSFLFTELPMLERFDAAATCGFPAVEFMFPYDYDLADLKGKLAETSQQLVLFNLPAGDFAAGERGIAVDPTRVEEFVRGVEAAVVLAPELGCTRINCLSGIVPLGLDEATAHKTLVSNVRFAAAALADVGVTLCIEPINRIDTPRFAIGTTSEATSLISEVGMPNVRLQFDIYHAQRAEGNIIDTMTRTIDLIAHVQIADSPNRNEPGTGELSYEPILRKLDELGYTGWVGLEYKPSRQTAETLGATDSRRTARASNAAFSRTAAPRPYALTQSSRGPRLVRSARNVPWP